MRSSHVEYLKYLKDRYGSFTVSVVFIFSVINNNHMEKWYKGPVPFNEDE